MEVRQLRYFAAVYEQGTLHTRPIVKPALKRTLYVCQMADQTTSFALNAVPSLIEN